MNKRYLKWLKSEMLCVFALLGCNACSDDHFDILPSVPTASLWVQIESDQRLDSLRQILEKTTFTLNEYSPSNSTLTYAQLLQSSQTFTVWAPEDGTYNAGYWLDQLKLPNGNFDVEKRFIRNHIARYNFPGVNGGDTIGVTMLNSKVNDYILTENKFKNVQIDGVMKPASNGSLHLLKGEVSYVPNIYEMIEKTEGLDSLYKFLHEDDTLMFNEGASTPGATVNGDVQYVDSVFSVSNKIIGSLSNWKNEDSLMIAVFPNNEGWNDAMSKLNKYFKYKNSYPYTENGNKQIFYKKIDADSMRNARVHSVLLGNMITSLGKQPTYDITQSSLNYLREWITTTDSIVRGGYANLSNPNIYQPHISELFSDCEMVQVSNGFVCMVDKYNYHPNEWWHTTIRLEAESNTYQDVNNFSSAAKENRNSQYYGTAVSLTELNRNDSVIGKVSNNRFRYFPGSNAVTQPTVSFKIPNIQAGKYNIYVVMVPLNINKPKQTTVETKRNRFSATLTYDYDEKYGRAKTQNATNEVDNTNYFETHAGVVDTICLFRDFEFPYAFQGAEPSYPTISLKTVIRTKDEREKFDYPLYIDCFLFESKDE